MKNTMVHRSNPETALVININVNDFLLIRSFINYLIFTNMKYFVTKREEELIWADRVEVFAEAIVHVQDSAGEIEALIGHYHA